MANKTFREALEEYNSIPEQIEEIEGAICTLKRTGAESAIKMLEDCLEKLEARRREIMNSYVSDNANGSYVVRRATYGDVGEYAYLKVYISDTDGVDCVEVEYEDSNDRLYGVALDDIVIVEGLD